MRKFIGLIAVIFILVVGFFGWRMTHPKLTDEEQIAVSLDGICAAADARSSRGVANYLAPNFQVGGTKKSEFQNSLAGGMLQYRVVDLQLPTSKNVVTGDIATTDGSYALSLKSEYDSPAEIQRGKFKLRWQKIDGQWLVTGADIENPQLP